MSAYLILHYDVTDPERLAAYREAATPVLLGEGRGEVLAVDDKAKALEGTAGSHAVLLRFDSVEQARQLYESEEYQATIGDRLGATRNGVAILVRGV